MLWRNRLQYGLYPLAREQRTAQRNFLFGKVGCDFFQFPLKQHGIRFRINDDQQ